jgi:hypothetical protein
LCKLYEISKQEEREWINSFDYMEHIVECGSRGFNEVMVYKTQDTDIDKLILRLLVLLDVYNCIPPEFYLHIKVLLNNLVKGKHIEELVWLTDELINAWYLEKDEASIEEILAILKK